MNEPESVKLGDDQAHIKLTRNLVSHPPSTAGCRFPIEIIQGPARSDMGTLMIPGLIENESDKWIAIMLHVHLYDSSGREMEATNAVGKPFTASALNATIPPHGIGPFMGYNDEADVKGKAASIKLTVFRAVEAARHPRAELVNVKVELGENVCVTGVYANTGNEACLYPSVVGIGYTADGQIYIVDMSELEDSNGECLEALPPGETRPFEFEFSSLLDTSMLTQVQVVPGYDSKEA